MAEPRSLEILKPGLVSTVQDTGRYGYYHLGIPPSGSLDQVSSMAANLLVGNPETAAVIEAALIGPDLRFDCDTVVALTGALMTPTLDGEPRPHSTAFAVKAGQTLSLGFAAGGARGYLAVAGGIEVPAALGSRSTYALGSLGGLDGRPLQAGDVLRLGDSTRAANRDGTELPEDLRVSFAKERELRMVRGLYDHRVKPESMERFLRETWTVASEADRVGYRLKGGTPLDFVEREQPFGAGDDPSNIVDACYPVGSIQVPSGQEPIILQRDAVSGGGYMMIGAVISVDLDLVGQLPPNAKVRFVEVSLDEAVRARAEARAHRARIRAALA